MRVGVEIIDWPLYLYLLLMITGVLIASPKGNLLISKLPFSQRFETALATDGGRISNGALLVSSAGFLVSTHTLYIHEKLHELGGTSGCSAYGLFDCGDVISNADYNVDPVFSLPWGMWGMFAFAAISFTLLVIRNSLEDPNIDVWIGVSGSIALIGMVPIVWLIYVELVELGKFCQYCSGAHLANILCVLCAFWMYKSRETENWSKRD